MIERREVVCGALALAVAGGVPLRAQPARAPLRPTQAQTAGPFYPLRLPPEHDADLARHAGAAAPARGELIHVRGRIVAADGRPLGGTRIELWQADAQGLYPHPHAPGAGRHDRGFQGYGVAVADADGRYGFRTIRPGRYPGRTPHLHFRLAHPAVGTLTTQMYFAGDPGNPRDALFAALSAEEQAALLVAFAPAAAGAGIAAGATVGHFDVVLAA